jgi:hypothetical protein
MKQHWETLFELYSEGRRTRSHQGAIAFALANWAEDLIDRLPGEKVPERALKNVLATFEAWNSVGSADWLRLREDLRHAWTDGVL